MPPHPILFHPTPSHSSHPIRAKLGSKYLVKGMVLGGKRF